MVSSNRLLLYYLGEFILGFILKLDSFEVNVFDTL